MLTQLVNDRCLELGKINCGEEEALARIRKEYGVLPENLQIAAGLLGELYTRMNVEELARRRQNVSIFWMFAPVTTKQYVFSRQRRGKPNINVRRRSDARSIGEVDLVMMVEDSARGTQTPVIIETHLAGYRNGGRASVGKMLSQEKVERKKDLIKLLFNNIDGRRYEEPVVVYVVPQEQLRNLTVKKSNMFQFAGNGGLVVPFHTTRHGWMGEVERMVAQCNGEKTDAPESGYKMPSTV